MESPLLIGDEGKHPRPQEETQVLPSRLDPASSIVHLAFFGVLGVLTRYWLQKLFGPQGIGATDGTMLYLDLPSNMLGCFLMGWFGIVFKPEIAGVSSQLALGLSTGYLGSLTTFSGWNQKMVELGANGQLTIAVLGFIIGLLLAAYSIEFGIETAQGTKRLLQKLGQGSGSAGWSFEMTTLWQHLVAIIGLLLMWGLLWVMSASSVKREFENGGSGAQLWLGCLVGPFGVWVRWWLGRFNGRGLGRARLWSWVPLGTLMANVSAACLMAALAVVKKVADTKTNATVVGGIQLGFLGCLSTVSTFILEFNEMRQSSFAWRAYAYAVITTATSFGLGVIIYTAPVWAKGHV